MAITTAAAIIGGSLLSAATSVAGSMAQKKQAKKARKAQEAASEKARADLAPWREAGQTALGNVTTLLTDPNVDATSYLEQHSPGYRFRQSEGNKALTARQTAGPGVYSGRAMKEAIRYNQDFASGEFSNYISQLLGLSGQGQQAAAGQANTSMQAGNNIAATHTAQGNATADMWGGINDAAQGGLSNTLAMQEANKWGAKSGFTGSPVALNTTSGWTDRMRGVG